MRNTVLRLFTVLFLLAANLPAEVVIKRYHGPLPTRQPLDQQAQAELPPAIPTLGSLDKGENPTSFYILPAFKIDSTSPSGETTAIAVRNEDSIANIVVIELYEPNSFSDPVVLTRALLPKEVWTVNLRSETGALPADFGGFIRGWARILTVSQPISADFFQVDSGQDFATGGRLADVNGLEFCKDATLRFLVGGAFSGGTLITFMLGLPLGGDPMSDPPSITGTVYRESGAIDGTFEIYTDSFSLEVDAANLIFGENFGSMDLTFENASGGGFAIASYKADNRYSVSIKSVCLDSLTP